MQILFGIGMVFLGLAAVAGGTVSIWFGLGLLLHWSLA